MSRRKAALRSTFNVLGLVLFTATLPLAAAQNFNVPEDTALRIRLDDTLTSVDSQVGDPFSATVVDAGEYRNARVYGHITEIDMSGRVEGHSAEASIALATKSQNVTPRGAIFGKSPFDSNPDLPPRKRRHIFKVAIIIYRSPRPECRNRILETPV